MFLFRYLWVLAEEVFARALAVHSAKEFFHLDFALKLHQAVEHRFRTRRTSRDVDIHRNNLVNTCNHVVGVFKRSARNRATTNRDYILRLGELLIQAAEHRRHTMHDCARNHHKVGLAWA